MLIELIGSTTLVKRVEDGIACSIPFLCEQPGLIYSTESEGICEQE